MSVVVIVGTQWGDEGKGKITDFLAKNADCVARFSGGNNAGHTIKFEQETYKLHLVPSGIFYKDKLAVIGNGCFVEPKSLVQELDNLAEKGISFDNLRISNRASVVLPYHLKQDTLEEERRGNNKIGTTKKGIGPAVADKVSRIGLRMADLIDKDVFREKLEYVVQEKKHLFKKLYNSSAIDLNEIFSEYYSYGQRLMPYVCDTSVLIDDLHKQQKNILFEGAQGIMLDIDHGTYPFVTSTNPIAGGVSCGIGFAPAKIKRVLGVSKAYMTRVGEGPFTTEMFDNTAIKIRETGNEYGTTTGRPRRIGWLDGVVMRHSVRVSGITDLSVNCLDVLSGISPLKICVAYKLHGKLINFYPANLNELAQCVPVYEEFEGWNVDITNVRGFDDLPTQAKKYLTAIEELTETKIAIVSVGPARNQTFSINDVWTN